MKNQSLKLLVVTLAMFAASAHAAPKTFQEAEVALKAKWALKERKSELKAAQKAEREALKERQKAQREALKTNS